MSTPAGCIGDPYCDSEYLGPVKTCGLAVALQIAAIGSRFEIHVDFRLSQLLGGRVSGKMHWKDRRHGGGRPEHA